MQEKLELERQETIKKAEEDRKKEEEAREKKRKELEEWTCCIDYKLTVREISSRRREIKFGLTKIIA